MTTLMHHLDLQNIKILLNMKSFIWILNFVTPTLILALLILQVFLAPTKEKKTLPSSFILMVNRGSCTFQTKVRNAQKSGATALIVADNICRCSDEEAGLCTSHDTTCEEEPPFMGSDGSEDDIHIPSMLMLKHDADIIKMKLVAGHSVRLEIAWMRVPTEIVQYNLWTTPANFVSTQFLLDFRDVALALQDNAKFKPYTVIHHGCTHKIKDVCDKECTNNGRYCASYSSDDEPFDELDLHGNVFVKESLRRMCIWKEYGEENGLGKEWWNYVVNFIDLCHSEEFFDNEDCIADVYQHSSIDKSKVDICMKESGGLEGDVENSLLEEEKKAEMSHGNYNVIPSVEVNTFEVEGDLSAENVFNAICSNFLDDAKPEICRLCVDTSSLNECVIPEKVIRESGFADVAIIFVMICLGAFVYCKGFRTGPAYENPPGECEVV